MFAWLGPLKSVRHEDPAVAEAPEGDGILLQRASVGSRILPKWCEMRKLFIEYADTETHTQTHSEERSARSGKMILKKHVTESELLVSHLPHPRLNIEGQGAKLYVLLGNTRCQLLLWLREDPSGCQPWDSDET